MIKNNEIPWSMSASMSKKNIKTTAKEEIVRKRTSSQEKNKASLDPKRPLFEFLFFTSNSNVVNNKAKTNFIYSVSNIVE